MKKRREEMTQADVEEILGPGVPVDPADTSFNSRRWKCFRCKARSRVRPAREPVDGGPVLEV